MYLLAHYFTHKNQSGAYHCVGGLLPDITPGFTSLYNRHIRKAAVMFSTETAEIHRGISDHFKADSNFHNNNHFLHLTKTGIKSLEHSGLDRSKIRLSVVAHIMVEMAVDHELVNLYPQLTDEFYHLLQGVEVKYISHYFDKVNSSLEHDSFIANFTRFMERKYLYRLHEYEGVAEGLSIIYSTATNYRFSSSEKDLLIKSLRNIQPLIRLRLNHLITL
jgi:hypothetical protein